MCEAILYEYMGQLRKSFFSNNGSKLPVIASFDRIKFITWGRHEKEQVNFPVGGTLYREDILKGLYDIYEPKPVKLPVLKFLEKDHLGVHHWYEVTKGFWMQGLLASDGNEYRIYIVTIRPEMPDASYNHWPRLLCNPPFGACTPINH